MSATGGWRARGWVLMGLLAVVAAVGCGARDDRLVGTVELHCRGEEERLRGALEANEVSQPASSSEMFREFSFCQMVRRGDEAQLTAMSVEFQKAAALVDEKRDDPVARGEAMRVMLDLFARVNRLPIRR